MMRTARTLCIVAVAALVASSAFAQKKGAAKTPAKAAEKTAAKPDAGVAGPVMPTMPTESSTASSSSTSGDGGTSESATSKSDVKPEEKLKTRFYEGMGKDPSERAVLEEVSKALEAYEEESKDFRREIQLLVEKKYEDKRNTLANSYEKAIRDLEVLERRERLDAIAAFEEFLSRYPNDPRYTPDVMFRLAELYYERSSDDHNVAMREYEDAMRKLDPEKNATPPPEPKVDFSKSIALYQRLISDFPSYKLNDAAYYLLGYCQEKQEDFEHARTAYEALIANYPTSKFTIEAWVRIGEYYFEADQKDFPDALTRAADAYEHAVKDSTHPLFDKAVYKLGWTYYRMDRFEEAVGQFIALIDYYEAEAKKKGEETVGGDLRSEALQYTAISFVDEKWGSLAKAQEIFQKIGGRGYESEVYRRMADVYFDQTKHTEAVEAYRLVLSKDPLGKDAPQIQQRIVQAFERDRKLEDAFNESSKLANMFIQGTPWYDKWKRDPDVVQAAGELAERSLYSTGIYHHQQAIVYKNEQKYEQAKSAFETAAKAYGTYLARFPRSKNAYELEFYYAECLYNSFQFVEAAKHYAAVRDSGQDVKYQNDAAYATVLARQKAVEMEQRSNACPKYPVLTSTQRKENEVVKPIPLCESERLLVEASDKYLTFVKADDEKAPAIAYKAAEIFYTHNMFDDARARFKTIITSYPKNEVAKFATNLTVETRLIDKDWAKVEEEAQELAKNKDVIDPNSELYKELMKFKLGGRFKLAEELMSKGDYDNAARKYIELVDEEPKHEFADKALNNAAVCFENVQRFDSALRLYERIVNEYSKSPLADAALFRVALNAEKSYDFDKAIDRYQKLYKDYTSSPNRESALFNTARLLEGLQRYNEAAAAYLRYADAYPKSDDAAKNQFKAALIYEKQNDYNKEIAALNEFVQRFKAVPVHAELIVDAKKRIGEAFMKLKKESDALKAFEAAADEFDRRGLKPDAAPIAAEAAAFSRFQLAEVVFEEFDKIKIGGTGKALQKSFNSKKEAVKKVNTAYDKIVPYKRAEWTLAAFYRKGYVLERFAETILTTPIPPEVKRLGDEAVAAYQDQLSGLTVALEERAVETYIEANKAAKQFRVSNEWTKKTLESLNRYRPKEYPVLKEPKQVLSGDLAFSDGAVSGIEGMIRTPSTPTQKLKEDDK